MATGKAEAKATGTCWQRGLRPGLARERSCAKGFEAGPHFGIKGWQGSCVEGWGRDPGWVRYFAKAGAFPQQQQPGLGVIQVPQGFQKRLARINPLGLGVGRAKSMAPNGGPQQSKSSGPVNCKPCREAVWSTRPSWDVVMSLHLAGLSAKPTWRAAGGPVLCGAVASCQQGTRHPSRRSKLRLLVPRAGAHSPQCRLHGQGKQKRPQRIALLHPSFRRQRLPVKQQAAMVPVAPLSVRGQPWEAQAHFP